MMLERQVAARNERLTCQGRFEIKHGLKDKRTIHFPLSPGEHGGRRKERFQETDCVVLDKSFSSQITDAILSKVDFPYALKPKALPAEEIIDVR